MGTIRSEPAGQVLAANIVGVTEFRGNLAKYLKSAKAGRAVVVLERGERAYVLRRIEAEPPQRIFGCMRERTEMAAKAVVGASEHWSAAELP
jgi:antitoxin (DNA-binding transcriptional repressor) of toxin-antitoxin stability system